MWDFLRYGARGGAALILIAGALPAAPTAADILHLRDGSRHYGELISEDRGEIVFRIVAPGGASTVSRFPVHAVLRVEPTAEVAPPAGTPAERAPRAGLTPRDCEQILREAYELLDDGDRSAGQRALQRLVQVAPDEILTQLDAQCARERDRSIGELLAATRLDAALESVAAGEPFRLRGVTRMESAALGVLLERRTESLLDEVYSARSIREWATGSARYDVLKPESRKLVSAARLAAAMLAARVRHDPRLAGAADERKRLTALRAALTRFAAGVMSLPGYTAAPMSDAEAQEWLRRHVGRGGTLLQRLSGASATQPAASQPTIERGERVLPPEIGAGRPPRTNFPEEDEEP